MRSLEDILLNGNDLGRAVFFVALHRLMIPSEHAFAGARSIDQDLIEESGQACCNVIGILIKDDGVCDAGTLDITKERLGPLEAYLVSDKKSPAAQILSYPARLASRSRAQIKYDLAGLCRQHFSRQHGRRLLRIVDACMVIGIAVGEFLRHVVTA